jgi:competence protein ComEC
MSIFQELRKIPFVRLLIPLITGLIIGIQINISCAALVIACFLLLVPLCIFAFNILQEKYKYRWVFGLSLYVFIIISGILLIKLRLIDSKKLLPQIDNTECFVAKVIDQPQDKTNTVKVILKIIGYRNTLKWLKCKIKVLTYFQKDRKTGNISNGDIIVFRTKLREISEPGNPGEFNYKKYLSFKGIVYQSYINSGAWIIAGHEKNLMILASDIRNTMLQLYKRYGFDNDEYAVLSALTLG